MAAIFSYVLIRYLALRRRGLAALPICVNSSSAYRAPLRTLTLLEHYLVFTSLIHIAFVVRHLWLLLLLWTIDIHF